MNILSENYRLIVMTKTPQAGKVKTRMQPKLTEEQSAQLQDALIKQVMGEWRKSPYSIDLWFSGNKNYFQKETCHKYAQVDGDLGVKMSAAIKQAFNNDNLEGVIVVGTDCPFIDKACLSAVEECLRVNDVVIVPALDGGYVLIAMNDFYPELFQGIDWGTDKVFKQSCQRILTLGLSYQVLEAVPDIDLVEDLKYLRQDGFISELREFSNYA